MRNKMKVITLAAITHIVFASQSAQAREMNCATDKYLGAQRDLSTTEMKLAGGLFLTGIGSLNFVPSFKYGIQFLYLTAWSMAAAAVAALDGAARAELVEQYQRDPLAVEKNGCIGWAAIDDVTIKPAIRWARHLVTESIPAIASARAD
jgi:hypothetical protein